MSMPRWLLAVVIGGVAALQAWDSHALQAGAMVQLVIAAGILLPAVMVLVSADPRLRGGAVVVAGLLFAAARFLSDVRLPDLTLAALFPAMLLLIEHVAAQHRRAELKSRGE